MCCIKWEADCPFPELGLGVFFFSQWVSHLVSRQNQLSSPEASQDRADYGALSEGDVVLENRVPKCACKWCSWAMDGKALLIDGGVVRIVLYHWLEDPMKLSAT